MLQEINKETKVLIEKVGANIEFSNTKDDLLNNISELIIELAVKTEEFIIKIENSMMVSTDIGMVFEEIKMASDNNILSIRRLANGNNYGVRFTSIKKKIKEEFKFAKENFERLINLLQVA